MLRRILIGLDGSAYSGAALELGIRWANRTGAALVGLGIIDAPDILRPQPMPIGGSAFKQQRDDAMLAEARDQVEKFLKAFAERCAKTGVEWRLLEGIGLPEEQIALEAQRFDLILLGQQTYFHFETQEGPDETLHKVLKNSPRPVVTAPAKLREGNSVVIAYDGSLQAARAVYALAASGLAIDQQVHVVSVARDGAEAEKWAARAVEFLLSHGLQVHTTALATSASVADVLREQVQKLRAGLLVMGAYGKPLLHDFFFGSVTQALLKDSEVPLFLTH